VFWGESLRKTKLFFHLNFTEPACVFGLAAQKTVHTAGRFASVQRKTGSAVKHSGPSAKRAKTQNGKPPSYEKAVTGIGRPG